MALSDKVAPCLPMLRRYARALTGRQKSGDAYVGAVLQALVEDPAIIQGDDNLRVQLFHIFHRIWQTGSVGQQPARLTPSHRQALLLTVMEGFSSSEAGMIMSVSPEEIDTKVAAAMQEIEAQQGTKVLVIEDEPLIALDLEQIVEAAGHKVMKVATTHGEAVKAAHEDTPGLVLADIQLADNSSGIEAVSEILEQYTVPVIFITAFPDRLLTGERPEPTFLVTKPFKDTAVKAAISQALFFSPFVDAA